jgi:hypothetical protein
MRSLLSTFWVDDMGAVVAPEIVLILAITVIGLIPGLVALRNTTDAALATIGNELLALQVGFSFAPFSIIGSPAGDTIASVDGAQYSVSGITFLASSSAGTTNTFSSLSVNPAP